MFRDPVPNASLAMNALAIPLGTCRRPLRADGVAHAPADAA
jgi:hypothetical protein